MKPRTLTECQAMYTHMKSLIAKRLNSILVNLRYLRFKLLKYKENNKKICNTFDHNFKNILLYIMRKVSLERYYFVLYDCALTSKMSKMALKSFCDKTLHIYHLFMEFLILRRCEVFEEQFYTECLTSLWPTLLANHFFYSLLYFPSSTGAYNPSSS